MKPLCVLGKKKEHQNAWLMTLGGEIVFKEVTSGPRRVALGEGQKAAMLLLFGI